MLLWRNKQYYLKQKPEEESQAHKGDVIVGEHERQGNGSLQVERAQEDGLPTVDVGQRAKHQTSEHDAEKVYRRGDVGQVVTIAHQVKLEKRWLRSSMSSIDLRFHQTNTMARKIIKSYNLYKNIYQ